MHVLEAAQYLVHEELNVVVRQRLLRLDDFAQIGLHEVKHDIDFAEALSIFGCQQSLDTKDVLVLEQALNLELAISTQRENAMLESLHNLLDGD